MSNKGALEKIERHIKNHPKANKWLKMIRNRWLRRQKGIPNTKLRKGWQF